MQEYDTALFNTHQWMGNRRSSHFTGIVSWNKVDINGLHHLQRIIAVLLFAGIIYTAHLGGELTMVGNFLFADFG
jgi:hypothetical protein